MYKKNKVALVVPAYNEQRLIGPTIERVPRLFDKVYVVDDGSKDKTSEIVKKHSKRDRRIELVLHGTNKGVGQAIITGYERCLKENFDVAVVVGGDNQMPLEEVASFLDPIVKGEADYVKGNRFITENETFKDMPKTRLFANSLISLLTKIASGYYKIFDVVDGYTAISKNALRAVKWSHAWKGYGYPMDFLIRLNTFDQRVKDVPRTAIYLKGERQSQIKPLSYLIKVSPMLFRGFLWRLWEKYVIRDFHPLVFFYLISFILLPLGVVYGFYLLYLRFTVGGIALPGVILDLFLLVSGLQLFLFAMWFDMDYNRSLKA